MPTSMPTIEIVRTQPEQEVSIESVRPSSPLPAVTPTGSDDIDMNDLNVPAYIRRQREQEQRSGSNVGMPRNEPPVQPSVPVSSSSEQSSFNAPLKKAASGSQPAFLRKIMD
jgi:hypothetical protein